MNYILNLDVTNGGETSPYTVTVFGKPCTRRRFRGCLGRAGASLGCVHVRAPGCCGMRHASPGIPEPCRHGRVLTTPPTAHGVQTRSPSSPYRPCAAPLPHENAPMSVTKVVRGNGGHRQV